jgi:hypothetical protein
LAKTNLGCVSPIIKDDAKNKIETTNEPKAILQTALAWFFKKLYQKMKQWKFMAVS